MNSPIIEIPSGSFMIPPFPVDAPEDYVPKDNFPFCCNYHSTTFRNIEGWFERFPNCCEPHKKMSKEWWYKKATYEGVSLKILNCVAYTQHHIAVHVNNGDWYKDITDYIEYILHSFGTPGIGSDRYLNLLKESLNSIRVEDKPLTILKKKPILEYLNMQSGPSKGSPTDLNAVIRTYQKWLKLFPFDLFPFNRIKDHFENQLPIIQGTLEYNPYLKMAKGKPHTPSSLIEFLCGLTKQILEKINSSDLVKKGEIADTERHSMNIIAERHRIKQSALLVDYSKSELKYITVLKSWLKNEKVFFAEINPILKQIPQSEISKTSMDMIIKIPTELKALAAALKNLDFGRFLQSDSFENLMLKNDLDELWSAVIKQVNPGDTIYVGNTRVHQDAFFFATEQLWINNRPKFYRFTSIVIAGLKTWVKADKDFSEITEAISKLDFSKEQLEVINSAVSKSKPEATAKQAKVTSENKKIFVGHGKGSLWREVEAYLRDEGLPFESFESNNRTGEHIIDILKGFLDSSVFAIIVVTADDETAGGTIRARQNVIHEIGLFQGRLGFEKVAILKQNEAEEFSNNAGLQHIPFPKDNIRAAFHDLGQSLKKAGIKAKK